MSYIVLARKWRPTRFEDVVGQEHVIQTLMNALKLERLGHAFIFAGPRGVGKTTSARLLARAVNCENQPATNPCDSCESCTGSQSGKNMDLIEIDGASHRGIDEIRNLRENIRFAPASSRYKIYIIDEVHMLSKEAFNALLKTLEEPPAHAIFIFATTEIHRVPLTILSRCQRFDFKRIPSIMIADQLQKICDGEKIQIDRDSLMLIARKSDGCMRDATSILDQMASFSDAAITLQDVEASLGLVGEDFFFDFTDIMIANEEAAVLAYARKIYQQGHDLMNYLGGLQEHFRNLLVARSTGSAKLIETSEQIAQRYLDASAKFEERDLVHYIDIVCSHEQTMKFSENPFLLFELLLLKLTHKPHVAKIDRLLELLGSGAPAAAETATEQVVPSAQQPQSSSEPPPKSVVSGETPAAAPQSPEPDDIPQAPESQASKPEQRKLTPPNPKPPDKSEPPKKKFESLKIASLPQADKSEAVPDVKVESAAKATQEVVPDVSADSSEELSSSESSVSVEKIKEIWPELISRLKAEKKILLSSFLRDGVPYRTDGDTLELAFDLKTAFNMSQVERERKTVQRFLASNFDIDVKISCTAIDFESEKIEKTAPSAEDSFQDLQNKEPVLKKIIDLFDCENIE